MLESGSWLAKKIDNGLMRLHLRRQRLVTYPEIKQMFGCGFPDDVWTLLANIPSDATRAEVIDGLRRIATRDRAVRAPA